MFVEIFADYADEPKEFFDVIISGVFRFLVQNERYLSVLSNDRERILLRQERARVFIVSEGN